MAMLSNLRKAAADSLTEDIRMIHIDNLFESPDNYFAMSCIEDLADAITGQGGVKENLIVRLRPDGNYEIVSGHRRSAAVRHLLQKGESVSEYLPCLIEEYADEEEKRLALVLMNVSARQISDAEMLKSYEVIKEVLEQKKSLGESVGRLRDRIAALLGISVGQAAKIENIGKHAVPEVKEAVESGDMSISTADKISKLDKDKQKKLAKKKPLSKVKPKDIETFLADEIPDCDEGFHAPEVFSPDLSNGVTNDTSVEEHHAPEVFSPDLGNGVTNDTTVEEHHDPEVFSPDLSNGVTNDTSPEPDNTPETHIVTEYDAVKELLLFIENRGDDLERILERCADEVSFTTEKTILGDLKELILAYNNSR